jgi:hypothetical protein
MPTWRDVKVQDTAMPRRARMRFLNEGFKTLGDIADLDDETLLRMPAIGRKALRDVRGCIAAYKSWTTATAMEEEDDPMQVIDHLLQLCATSKVTMDEIARSLKRLQRRLDEVATRLENA